MKSKFLALREKNTPTCKNGPKKGVLAPKKHADVVACFEKICYAIIRGQSQERLPDRANGVQAVHVYLDK